MSTSSPGPDPRAMNAQMTQRLLVTEPDEIPVGGYGLRVLEVPGRRSGEPRRTPVGLLRLEDGYRLVCPDRTRDWPSNLIAAGHGSVLAGGRRDDYRTEELHGRPAAEAVSRYLAAVDAPWAVAAFGLPDHPTPEQVEPALDRMAVFALVPEQS